MKQEEAIKLLRTMQDNCIAQQYYADKTASEKFMALEIAIRAIQELKIINKKVEELGWEE